MNLIEVKILYNADYIRKDNMILSTEDHIKELVYWVNQRPDVIHISKTVIPEGGDDND